MNNPNPHHAPVPILNLSSPPEHHLMAAAERERAAMKYEQMHDWRAAYLAMREAYCHRLNAWKAEEKEL